MDNTDFYKTSDRNLLAWLRYRGHAYADTHLEGGKRVWFYFRDSEELQEDIRNYNNKEVFYVSPLVLFKELETVTDIIYQIKNQHG